MTNTLPNRNVVVPASILIFAGASSVATAFLGVLDDALLLSPLVLALPIGYGILVGNENSRLLARVGCGVMLAGVCVGLVMLAVYAVREQVEESISQGNMISPIMWTILSLIVFLGLRKDRVGDWFRERRNPAFARSCTLAISLLAGAHTAENYFNARELQSQMSRAFPVHVRFKPVDSETGDGLRSIALPLSIQGSDRRQRHDVTESTLPRLGFGSMATSDGLEVIARGILLEPTQILIEADGYEEVHVTIDQKTETDFQVPMVKREVEPQDSQENSASSAHKVHINAPSP